jgi:AraC-like DNA-binding protein
MSAACCQDVVSSKPCCAGRLVSIAAVEGWRVCSYSGFYLAERTEHLKISAELCAKSSVLVNLMWRDTTCDDVNWANVSDPSQLLGHKKGDCRVLSADIGGFYREWTPALVLSQHVHRFWINDLQQPRSKELHVIPDGCMDIVWDGQELRIAGPDTKPINISARRIMVGARFHPGVAPNWFRVPAAELVNLRVPLQEVWHKFSCDLLKEQLSQTENPVAAARVLDQALTLRLSGIAHPDSAMRSIVQTITQSFGDQRPIVQKLLNLGWNERTLRRRCLHAFGYGPKTLDRILRFQRFLSLLGRARMASLSALASEAGFSDHAHLVRETRRLAGLLPSEIRAERVHFQPTRGAGGRSGTGILAPLEKHT